MNQFQIRSQVFPMMMLRKDRKKWNFSAYLQIGANDLVVIPNKKNLLNVETYFQGKRSKKVENQIRCSYRPVTALAPVLFVGPLSAFSQPEKLESES